MVFTHGPQLLVKLGRYLVGAEVLHSLRNKNMKSDIVDIRGGLTFFSGIR